jgi:hypothetical protein
MNKEFIKMKIVLMNMMNIRKEKIIKKTLRNHKFQTTMQTLIMIVISNISNNIKVASQILLLHIIIDRAEVSIKKDTALTVNQIMFNNHNKGHQIKISEILTNNAIIPNSNNIAKVI